MVIQGEGDYRGWSGRALSGGKENCGTDYWNDRRISRSEHLPGILCLQLIDLRRGPTVDRSGGIQELLTERVCCLEPCRTGLRAETDVVAVLVGDGLLALGSYPLHAGVE